MCAFDLPTTEKRDLLVKNLYQAGLIIIGCGVSTIRFRPPLIISSEEIDETLSIIDSALKVF